MDTTVLVALVGVGGVVAGAAVSGVVAAWVAHRQGKAQDKTAQAAVIAAEATASQAITAGFATLTAQYEARNKDLLQQNEELSGKLDEALGKLDEALAQNDQLAGELRDLTQHVESLENALREGRPIPARRKRPHPMAKPPLAIIPGKDGQTDG